MHSSQYRWRPRGVAALLVVLIASSPALAHALHAVCRLKDNEVVVEAFFDGDEPAQHAKVRVMTVESGQLIGEGRTDKNGRWTFAKPAPGRYKVVVESTGHSAETTMRISSAQETASAPAPEPAPQISEGPSRTELTRFPWLKAVVGIGAIFGFFLAMKIAGRQRGKAEP